MDEDMKKQIDVLCDNVLAMQHELLEYLIPNDERGMTKNDLFDYWVGKLDNPDLMEAAHSWKYYRDGSEQLEFDFGDKENNGI